MKKWKIEFVNALEEKTTSQREISLTEAGNELGIAHVKSRDCIDIVHCFLKRNRTYKAVKLCTPTNWRYATLWSTGVLTELEYDLEQNFRTEIGCS